MFAMNRTYRIKLVTAVIIGINVSIFLLFNLLFPEMKNLLVMIKPLAVTGDFWRFLTSMFAHADLIHLAFNMACLFIFGQMTEMFFGKVKFLAVYLISGLCGTALSILFSPYSSLGASGAIYGVVSANLYLLTKIKGDEKKAFAADLIGFLVINLAFSVFSDDVDLSAHIGGMIGGIVTSFAFGTVREPVRSIPGILRASAGILLSAALLLFSVCGKTGNPDYLVDSILTRYEYYNAENAYRLSQKAVLRFPNREDLKELNEALRVLNR